VLCNSAAGKSMTSVSRASRDVKLYALNAPTFEPISSLTRQWREKQPLLHRIVSSIIDTRYDNAANHVPAAARTTVLSSFPPITTTTLEHRQLCPPKKNTKLSRIFCTTKLCIPLTLRATLKFYFRLYTVFIFLMNNLCYFYIFLFFFYQFTCNRSYLLQLSPKILF